jgi:hypothetical protein
MMGTNSVPPPMPAGTATMPMKKQVTNRASGQNHQGMLEEGTTLSAAAYAVLSNNKNAAKKRTMRNTSANLLIAAGLPQVSKLFMGLIRPYVVATGESAISCAGITTQEMVW